MLLTLLKVLLLEFPVFLLCMGKDRTLLLISIFVFFLTVCFLTLRLRQLNLSVKPEFPLSSLMICLLLASLFYIRWNSSGRLAFLVSIINRSPKQNCLIVTAFLGLISLPGIDFILKVLLKSLKISPALPEKSTKILPYLYLLLISILVISLNSKCSPVYPLNNLSDPNIMFTVGKGVLKGKVPYRDLYEHKGPLIIFMHTLAAAISYDSFTGIYILKILFCFAFLVSAYKIACLVTGSPKVIFLISFLAVCVYGSRAFVSGDLAEEFCLPLLSYGLNLGCKALLGKKLPTKKQFLLLGYYFGIRFLDQIFDGWILHWMDPDDWIIRC